MSETENKAGSAICPICGAAMIWNSDENASEISDIYQGSEIVSFYSCPNCGEEAEYYECPDEDKKGYRFWNKQTQIKQDEKE